LRKIQISILFAKEKKEKETKERKEKKRESEKDKYCD